MDRQDERSLLLLLIIERSQRIELVMRPYSRNNDKRRSSWHNFSQYTPQSNVRLAICCLTRNQGPMGLGTSSQKQLVQYRSRRRYSNLDG